MQDDVPGMVKSFPTLIVYSKGEPVHVYEGEREIYPLFETCMNACKLKR